MLKEVRSVHKHLECSVVAISFIYSVFMRILIAHSRLEKKVGKHYRNFKHWKEKRVGRKVAAQKDCFPRLVGTCPKEPAQLPPPRLPLLTEAEPSPACPTRFHEVKRRSRLRTWPKSSPVRQVQVSGENAREEIEKRKQIQCLRRVKSSF